ncbi:lytic transglycosylase [Shewanella sairae]|uniref:Lytic transglycosylase n=1 Tax=Shewanella sairae TaxID=190310 RepID=A0ABQ4PC45_9GAMM|nr:lytic murein transglycosylase [Shewanella sairae]MCL1129055.1 lytic murein transglycosylase [Shewanella sairae]GIU45115.1 lytic transglycosylase [Shewanella sairae]
MVLGKHALLLFCCLYCQQAFGIQVEREESFIEYVEALKPKALGEGISEQTVSAVFPRVKMFKKVLPTDKPDSESVVTLESYLPNAVTESTVKDARTLYKQYLPELKEIGARYGVQPRFIVALWGVESNFGQNSNDYSVLSVTASLAYEGRFEALFQKEFITALKIIENEELSFEQLKGTWVGAMGQISFMPSAYYTYAQDGDGDGKKDIWKNPKDVFASAAFYLQQSGWTESETWGRQVRLPSTFDEKLSGIKIKKSFEEWQALGVRRFDGSDLPKRTDMQISLIMPDGADGRKYLVYGNYRGLLNWKSSHHFALSVAYLSERIKFPAIN